MKKKLKLATICVQEGWKPTKGEPRVLPVFQSTTFKYDNSEQMARLFDLKDSGYFYTRLQNPTNDAVAAKIAECKNTQDIDDIVVKFCKDNNCNPTCLNYEGFPKAVCTSINEVVCHGIPKEEDVLEPGDIVNVDITIDKDGFYGDASRMFIIGGKTTPEKEELVRVTKECLEIGMAAAKPYGFVGDIGHAIQKYAEKHHYGVVRDLCGHGVGLAMHEEPEVCHFGHRGEGMLLVPGMTFTIEPMINMGTWKVYLDADDPYGWEIITGDEKPSAQWEHTLLMTENGVEILAE